jgi:hydrogenase maturation protease
MEASKSMISATHNEIVVIGYGSSLRSDDAVGRLIVERIADLSIPSVVTISLTQLVPELAEQIAGGRAVIFVDACVNKENCTVKVHELTSRPNVHSASHTSAPRELLALASECYGRSPPAWLVKVPAEELSMSERLSPTAYDQLQSAIALVERLVDDIRSRGIPER